MSRETVGRTLLVAFCLCVVCSLLVSAAAVGLRPLQEANQVEEIRRNILAVAGYDRELAQGAAVDDLFNRIEVRLVDLDTGEYVEGDPATYSAREAARGAETGVAIPSDKDLADIKRRARVKPVYLVRTEDGGLKRLILPVHGKGLWSTMYGFIALEPDTRTVAALTFYEHGETPGLGGEIDNPRWKASWSGKKWLGPDNEPALDVVKGQVVSGDPRARYQIDGLSGATLTANGVENTMRYWAGDHGFGPYLKRIRETS